MDDLLLQSLRSFAGKVVRYYERLADEEPTVWQHELTTARLWVRLMDEEEPAGDELDELKARIAEPGQGGTIWEELERSARDWMANAGF